jgi:hypothetical protein
MVVEFQVDGKTDLVVDIDEADIPYWIAAYKLIGMEAVAIRTKLLVAYVDFPHDSTLATRTVVKDDDGYY